MVIIAIIGFFIGAAFFGYWAWNHLLVKFPAYQTAKSYLNVQPEAQKILGNISKWDSHPSGEFFYNKQGGEGKLQFKVEGSLSKGEIFLKFKSEAGEIWIIKEASLKTATIKQPLPLTVPDDWLASAKKLVQQNKITEAMEQCAKIKTAVPDDYIAEYCLAEIELSRGNSTQYLEMYKRIKDKNPNNYHYQSQLGHAYYVIGDDENALNHLKLAWDLNSLPFIARDIALVHLNRNDTTKGAEWLKKAEEKGDQSAALKHLYGRYYLNRKEYQQAKAFFNQALKIDPYYTDSYFGLAYTYQDLTNIEEAVSHFEMGLLYAPWSSLKHRKNLIVLLSQNNMTDELTYHLKKVIEYHPQEIPPYGELARIYVSQQRWNEAKNIVYKLNQIDQSRATQLREQLGIYF